MLAVKVPQSVLLDFMERREALEYEFDLDKVLFIFLQCQENIGIICGKLSTAFKSHGYDEVKLMIATLRYEESLKNAAEEKVLSLGGSF